MSKYFKDLRLPEFERARLGARGTIFGSRDVKRLFNRLDGMMGRASLFRPRHEGDRMVTRVQVGSAFDELQGAIRGELGADTIRALTGRTARAEAP